MSLCILVTPHTKCLFLFAFLLTLPNLANLENFFEYLWNWFQGFVFDLPLPTPPTLNSKSRGYLSQLNCSIKGFTLYKVFKEKFYFSIFEIISDESANAMEKDINLLVMILRGVHKSKNISEILKFIKKEEYHQKLWI